MLLVGNIRKDFRFSLEGEGACEGFTSLMSVPLSTEHNIFGLLRVDSLRENFFSQSDLRFLDYLSDIAAVALQNSLLYKRAEDLAVHDWLTGLYVRKYFNEKLEEQARASRVEGTDFSLIMFDLDDFKKYNDKYGHAAGDLALKHISSVVATGAPAGSLFSRYGGEEFALLLPGENKAGAVKTAEGLRRRIEKSPLELRRESMSITVSAGVASWSSSKKTTEALLAGADRELYRAKKEGKNKVCG